MNDRISIHATGDDGEPISYPFKLMSFPGGEPHVEVDPTFIFKRNIWVDARLSTTNGFMSLLVLLDAIRACNPRSLGLFLPYFPGARQDRREKGTALTVKVYADIINKQSLDCLAIFDPHSEVTTSLLGADIISIEDILKPNKSEYAGVICPDAGAEKRVNRFVKTTNIETVIHARKHRDARTGKLSGFEVEALPFCRRYLVVDDICDGGGTFIGLANAIPKHCHDYKLDLWISHGIFSRGIEDLLNKYDKIITTDSFPNNIPSHERIIVNKLYPYAAELMEERLC